MEKRISAIKDDILKGHTIELADARFLSGLTEQKDIISLISHANIIRAEYKGSNIDTCAIINAKSGKCSEDCRFCSQSVHHNATIQTYPLKPTEEIVEKAVEAASMGAASYSIVVSGRGISKPEEIDSICRTLDSISKKVKIDMCASLGVLSDETALTLKNAGLKRYHHNLETSKSFYPNICTTHSYNERLGTIETAKKAGLKVCCGGIFGIGETMEHRLEFAFDLREFDVDSIPLNFLNPIPGTPLENAEPLPPMEILQIIAIFRFIHPDKDIRICGGREKNLRNTQALIYIAGASAVMIGDYLTVPGSDHVADLQLIRDLMLDPV